MLMGNYYVSLHPQLCLKTDFSGSLVLFFFLCQKCGPHGWKPDQIKRFLLLTDIVISSQG